MSNEGTNQSFFPDVSKIFSPIVKPIKEIFEQSIIILDTNSLLIPYNIGKQSLNQIEQTYKKLSIEGRIFIPEQVMIEFARNRPRKICEIHQQLLDKKSGLVSIQKGKYPLLEEINDYIEMVSIEKQIDKLIQDYKKSVDRVIENIKSWNWNDPVSKVYNEVFPTNCFIESPKIDENELRADLEYRKKYSIPPGYKDSTKPDGGVGDLIIWKTILELAKEKKKDVIFVSSDSKADWWHRSVGQGIYTRYELISEFSNYTGGYSIHIIQLSTLLDLHKVSEETIKEIIDQEITANEEDFIIARTNRHLLAHSLRELESNGIYYEDIETEIMNFKEKNSLEFSTIDIVRKFNNGGYQKGQRVNIAMGKVLSEAREYFSIEHAGKRVEKDDQGNQTTTVVWRIKE